jgi:hypothetical protein
MSSPRSEGSDADRPATRDESEAFHEYYENLMALEPDIGDDDETEEGDDDDYEDAHDGEEDDEEEEDEDYHGG